MPINGLLGSNLGILSAYGQNPLSGSPQLKHKFPAGKAIKLKNEFFRTTAKISGASLIGNNTGSHQGDTQQDSEGINPSIQIGSQGA
jgi:hypothetical protein